jgi:hypothetical protein
MQLNSALRFLVLGLSAMSVAEATFAGVNIAGRNVKGIQRRQDDDAKTDPDTTEAAPPEQTSSSAPANPTSEEPEESTPPPVTSSTPTKPPVTSSPATSTPAPTSSNTPPSSSANNDDNDSPTTSNSPKPTSSADDDTPQETTITSTQIITTTRKDGSPVTLTTETISTQTPGLAGDDNKGQQESGMSPQTRNTVIGVVVGVGGAIILGGLALVAWRIWGRKKHQEENDGLMDYGSAIESKPETGGSLTSRTPFQSTLESYHAPTQVNTAANF